MKWEKTVTQIIWEDRKKYAGTITSYWKIWVRVYRILSSPKQKQCVRRKRWTPQEMVVKQISGQKPKLIFILSPLPSAPLYLQDIPSISCHGPIRGTCISKTQKEQCRCPCAVWAWPAGDSSMGTPSCPWPAEVARGPLRWLRFSEDSPFEVGTLLPFVGTTSVTHIFSPHTGSLCGHAVPHAPLCPSKNGSKKQKTCSQGTASYLCPHLLGRVSLPTE